MTTLLEIYSESLDRGLSLEVRASKALVRGPSTKKDKMASEPQASWVAFKKIQVTFLKLSAQSKNSSGRERDL
jgi:hypothetical protein